MTHGLRLKIIMENLCRQGCYLHANLATVVFACSSTLTTELNQDRKENQLLHYLECGHTDMKTIYLSSLGQEQKFQEPHSLVSLPGT